MSEILAHTILSRGNLVEKESQADPKAQQTAIDFRREPPSQVEPEEKRARSSTDAPEQEPYIVSLLPVRTTAGPVVSEPASSSQSPLVRLIERANEPTTTKGFGTPEEPFRKRGYSGIHSEVTV